MTMSESCGKEWRQHWNGNERITELFGESFWDSEDCTKVLILLQEQKEALGYATSLEEVKVIARAQSGGSNPLDPAHECKPLGIPRGATGPMHIIQTPPMMAILYGCSSGPIYRTIYN